jgi:hypothetical protein
VGSADPEDLCNTGVSDELDEPTLSFLCDPEDLAESESSDIPKEQAEYDDSADSEDPANTEVSGDFEG